MVSALPLSLLLLFSAGSLSVHAGLVADELDYIVVATGSLKANSVCSGFRVDPLLNHTTNWLPLSRPHGPCSAAQAAARPSSVAEILRWDQHRADYINAKLSGELPQEDALPVVQAQTTVINHEGVIQPNLGTPKQSTGSQMMSTTDPAATTSRKLPGVRQTMVLDTASDVPWVQCVPCPVPPCHPQTDAVYDPTKSGTYAAFSCSSPACRQLGPYSNGCSGSQCQYRVGYPDGSATMGTYVSDVLTLTPTAVVGEFRFGCSHHEAGARAFDNRTAGIMALGGGPQSLVSQTAGAYGDVFSYCLPSSPSYKGFFTLGVPRVRSSRFVVTPMARNNRVPTFYVVVLEDLAVAGRRLGVPPAAFAAGAVMDSRSVITRLPPTAYAALRAAFVGGMGAYRRAAPKGQLDTCFDFAGAGAVRLPKIELVFRKNAAVELDPSGILFDDCLAFAPNGDDGMPGIIGNAQQQTLEVLYDVAGGAVGFRRAAC
ncbi:hypothetical protein ACP4OV_011020 [Aristida adscensionis]